MDGNLPPKLRGTDDIATKGFIHHSIVERLSAIVRVVPGCEDIAQELKDATFRIKPVDDTFGPSWTKYIEDELRESGSDNCLEVSWL